MYFRTNMKRKTWAIAAVWSIMCLGAEHSLAQENAYSLKPAEDPAASGDYNLGTAAADDNQLNKLYLEEEEEDPMLAQEEFIFPTSITDNWHLYFQVGNQLSFGSYTKNLSVWNRSNISLAFGLGKYLTPVNDVRIMAFYGRNTGVRGVDRFVDLSAGEMDGYIDPSTSQFVSYADNSHYTWHNVGISMGYLPNFTNLLLGYDEERRFSLSGLMGIDYEHSWGYSNPNLSTVSVWSEAAKSSAPRDLVGLQFGLLADYRLSDRWHLNLEAHAVFLDDIYDGLISENTWDIHANLMAGLTYYLQGKNHNGRLRSRHQLTDTYITLEENIFRQKPADATAQNIDTVKVTKNVTYTLISFDTQTDEVPRLQQNNIFTTAEIYKQVPNCRIFITNSSKIDDDLFHKRAWAISRLLHSRWQVPIGHIWVDADEDHIQQMQMPDVKHYIIMIINE